MKRKKPMKRTGFKKKGFTGVLEPCGYAIRYEKPRKRIKPVSKKRQKENKEYTRLRKEFLLENPRCAVAGCTQPSTEVHHKARRFSFYLRVDTWLAVCNSHHHEIEENGLWAKENGYTLTLEQSRKLNENSKTT